MADDGLSRLTDDEKAPLYAELKGKNKRTTTAFAANQELMYEVTDYARLMGQINPNNVARYEALRWTIGELAIKAAVRKHYIKIERSPKSGQVIGFTVTPGGQKLLNGIK
jgi:hypothetical protein